MRPVRILWPKAPELTDAELRVLRTIDWWRRTWNASASIKALRVARRLTQRGFIERPGFNGHLHGWHLTTLGKDVLKSLNSGQEVLR